MEIPRISTRIRVGATLQRWANAYWTADARPFRFPALMGSAVARIAEAAKNE